ncbi:hypothetical protein [Kitasatospora sp. NPDC056531]|uniref:hypothetical protein n=1 Tax=Kitasatospora sp. NPDC056531 TaxID=3345856 RepID=UPI00368E7DF2
MRYTEDVVIPFQASPGVIDDPGVTTTNGVRLQLWDCISTAAQKCNLLPPS